MKKVVRGLAVVAAQAFTEGVAAKKMEGKKVGVELAAVREVVVEADSNENL